MFERLIPDSSRFGGLVRILCLEAGFAVAYEVWVGPTFLSGLAGELKVDLGLVSVLAAIPWIGASGQLLGAWLFERSPSVKRYVLELAGVGRALWSVPLLIAAYWGSKSYWGGMAFPSSLWLSIAALCACLTALLTSASGNAWMFWMQSLIPSRFLGRFFGKRQRYTTSAFALASVVAAVAVEWKPGGYRLGLALLCGLALISGAISILLLARVADVPSREREPRSFRELIGRPYRDPRFRELLVFGAAFNGALQLASSYFPYYFTRELQIPMSSIALWSGLANLGCFASAGFWGKRVDRSGSPFEILWWAGHAVALSPLVYLVRDPATVQAIAPLEYLVNGLAWCGFLLAQSKLLIRLSPTDGGASYFSVYAATCGITGGICTFLGGQLARHLAPWGGFRALWAIASLSRLVALWVLCRPLVRARGRFFAQHAKA